MKRFALTGLAAFGLATALTLSPLSARADSVTAASQGSATALGHMVGGSGMIVQGGAEFAVASVTGVADSTVVVLRSLSTGAEASLRITGKGLGEMSRWTGKTLKAVGTTAGTILAEGTRVVLFIPAATAATLFHAAHYRGQQ